VIKVEIRHSRKRASLTQKRNQLSGFLTVPVAKSLELDLAQRDETWGARVDILAVDTYSHFFSFEPIF